MSPKQMRRIRTIGFLLMSMGIARHLGAAETSILRVSYPAPSGVFTPIWIAQDKGLFAKYDVKVDLKFISPSTATQALLGKSMDVVIPGGEFIEAGLGGEKMVYIAAIANKVVLSLYSKPEIQTVADLRGKTISALSPGSTSDFLARILLQDAKLTPGKDVKILYLKTGPEILAALTQGKIDAGIISAPVTLKARQAGLRELVDAADKNIAMIHAAFGSTRDVLRERADGVKKFLQGYVEGIKLAKSNSAEAKAVIGKYTQTSDPEELEETYRTFVRVWERAPYVSSAAVQTLLNFATNPKAKSSRPEQFIDNSLIAELENSGFIDRITKQ